MEKAEGDLCNDGGESQIDNRMFDYIAQFCVTT